MKTANKLVLLSPLQTLGNAFIIVILFHSDLGKLSHHDPGEYNNHKLNTNGQNMYNCKFLWSNTIIFSAS
jgi:hypothetical protein